jgi:hypothetical protein
MNISGLSNPRLTFQHSQDEWFGDQDTLGVYYKDSSVSSWTLIASYASNVSSWTQRTITLPNASTDYYIAFKAYSDYGRGVTLDAFTVEATPSCLATSSLTTSGIASDSANLSWTENGTATSWQVEWDTANFSQGAGNLLVTTSNPYSLDSLAADTEYDFYVRAICGAGDTSTWSTKGSFTTNCNAFTIPYTEGFESGYTHNTNVAGCLPQESVTGTQTWTANNTFTTYSRTPGTGSWNAFLQYGNNDWLFIPIALTGGTSYTAAVYANQDGTTTTNSNVGIRYGLAANDTAMTDTIAANTGISSTSQLITGTFTPTSSGTYYIGINGFMNTSPYYISIDDISIIETPNCPGPISLTTSDIASDSANLSWTENGTATSWQIEWDTANFSQGAGNLLVTTSNPYSLDSLAADTEYDFYVRAICGAGDTSAWSTKGSFTTNCNAFTIPYTEGFESGYTHSTNVAGCLSQESVTGTGTWKANNTLTSYGRTPRTGSWNAFLPWSNDDWLFIPITLTGGTSYTAAVYANQDGTTTTNSNVGIRYGLTANDTAMTDTIVANTGISSTSQLITGAFTPTSSGTYYIGINGFMNSSPYYISIDDISITETPSCPGPISLTTSGIASDSANLSWTENGTATSWQVEWDTANFSQGAGNLLVTASNPYSLDSLAADTEYDFYVRAICGAGDTSAWSTKGSFTTNCNAFTIPYTEGFESGYTHSTNVAGCLSQESVTGTQTWTANNTLTSYGRAPRTGDWNAFLRYGNDDWLFIPVSLTAGTPYTAEVYANQDGTTTTNSNVGIRYGLTATAAAMTDTIVANTGIGSTSQLISGTFTPATSGTYYVGINGFMNTSPWYISIDDISIKECSPTASTAVISACDNYTWTDGVSYTASNSTALDTFTNAAGCDSVVTLNLTIINSTASTDVISACDNYTWTDGVSYTASNNRALDTFTNAAGCDSVVTLNLTIINSTSSTDVISTCDNYTWTDGISYTASNSTAVDTFTNAAGCDSVVTLNLTILNSTSSTDVISACDNYTWTDGVSYTASNNRALDTFTNAVGCDSVVTLDLTILNSTSSTDVISTCDNYTWTDGISYTASNNRALDTFTNAAGCDSVVTLNLTILNSTSSSDVISACDNYTWTDGISYTASNTTALDTFTNAAGCDSVVTLDLTIIKNDLTITNNDPLLEATVQTGATYQWLNCLNTYSEIVGATNASFNGSTNGEYAIEITNSSCVDTSECQIIQLASVFESLIFEGVSIYPNPNTGLVNIDLNSLNDVAVNVYDISGNLIYAESNISGGVYQFNLEAAKGMYIIEISAADQTMRSKLIKR